jgi:YfiH family protein
MGSPRPARQSLGANRAGECDALPPRCARRPSSRPTAFPFSRGSWRGAAHAGWRGTAKQVAGEAVRALEALGAARQTLRAWLGPAIGPCCYEVGGEVAAQFADEFVRTGGGSGYRLDLKSVNAAQLQEAGIPGEAIAIHPACTKCGGEMFASYRRDGARAGRMIALIARR